MFYFKFFEVSISCRRKYCLYHAVSIKLPPSQPPLFIKDLIQKLLSYSLLSYTVTALGDATSCTGSHQLPWGRHYDE